ncbi:MAG TPA: DUF1294 domain-containing protein [Candidatus Nanoarchaeia archaeon]|nr:DUF1294 domain-containing protein [Candidatus Nanoarchaeia archaeon]
MNNLIPYFLIFLGLINILSFTIMLLDKNFSATGQWRVSEGALFFLAIFFGGPGIYLGMFAFHHKTRKWYFYFGIPLILIQNFCALVLLYQFLTGSCLFVQN